IIARRAAALAPFSVNVRSRVIGTDLLAVTLKTTVRDVNLSTASNHSGFRHGINVRSLFVTLRFEMPDLRIRNNGQPNPGKGERSKQSDEQWKQTLHFINAPPILPPQPDSKTWERSQFVQDPEASIQNEMRK